MKTEMGTAPANGTHHRAGNGTRAKASTRAVFVVGPGRSGTSVITRGLQALGVDLGDQFKAANRKNPTGFFEDAQLLAVAKQARAALGLKAESVALVPAAAWERSELERLRARAVGIIKDRFSDRPLWGFKYSQTLRYLPFWLPVLAAAGMQLDFVVAIRNPLSVARSRAKLDSLRGRQEKSDLEWLVNVVPYFRTLAQHRFVVVDYDLLLADPQTQLIRVAEALAISQTDTVKERVRAFAGEFLNPSLQHNRSSAAELESNDEINELTRDAYTWLRRLATDETESTDSEFWTSWARIERDLALMAPVLRHLDFLENRVRHTKRPIQEFRRRLKSEWLGRWRELALWRKTSSVP